MKSYSELFQDRGSSYDIAMRRYPDARREEFAQLINAVEIRPGMRIGDIPAGGGYLRDHLPKTAHWEGHEPCASFTNHGILKDDPSHSPLLPLPWNAGELDIILSLAGVHHIEDKIGLFSDMARVTKPGGHLVLSDVPDGSDAARFLDGFVGDHNSTGHEGSFLGPNTLAELAAAGWSVVSYDERKFTWNFANHSEMAEFARYLFDICKASAAQIGNAIAAELGTASLPGGGVGMHWSLMTIVCELEH